MRSLLLSLLLTAASASAQVTDPTGASVIAVVEAEATGSLGALDDSVTLDVHGRSGAGVAISTANLSATVVAEITLDGTNWSATSFITTGGTTASSLTFSGGADVQQRGIVLVGGTKQVRVRVSAYTSGTSTATVRSGGISQAASVAGGGGGGGLTDAELRASPVPVSASSLPLPTGAATEATLATRAAATQLPVALVGGRLDANLGAWLGSTAPTVSQKVGSASLPVVQASDYTGAFRTVTDTLDGAVLNDAVTIDGLGADSVTVFIGTGLAGAGTLIFECSNGSTFAPCPAARFISPAENFIDVINPTFGGSFTYKFLHAGFRQYRVRVSVAGSAGTSTVVMDASTGGTVSSKTPPYSAGSQPFDLTIPVNSTTINTQGAGMFGLTWSATLGASTVTPTAAGVALECYSLAHVSDQSRTSWTGAVQGIAWVCPLYGAASVTLTKDAGVGAGSSTLSFWVSMSSSVPNESRPVSQWVVGASPTSVLIGAPKPLLDPEGKQAVTLNHPRSFNCATTSTATTSTVLTGCGAPGAGLTRYITGIDWSSSTISTTANFMTIQYGTGAVCGTGTTVIYLDFQAPAFSGARPNIGTTPIRIGTNTDLCFLHPGAGRRLINVRGYVAP